MHNDNMRRCDNDLKRNLHSNSLRFGIIQNRCAEKN
jgi:hypothetical protein